MNYVITFQHQEKTSMKHFSTRHNTGVRNSVFSISRFRSIQSRQCCLKLDVFTYCHPALNHYYLFQLLCSILGLLYNFFIRFLVNKNRNNIRIFERVSVSYNYQVNFVKLEIYLGNFKFEPQNMLKICLCVSYVKYRNST